MEKEINYEELYKKKLIDMTKEELEMVKTLIDKKIADCQKAKKPIKLYQKLKEKEDSNIFFFFDIRHVKKLNK